jgi:hypothetical protein
VVADDDRVHLPDDDFRRERALFSPELFADPGTGGDLPPTDLVSKEAWTGLIDLPTDVLLRPLLTKALPLMPYISSPARGLTWCIGNALI